MMRKKFTYLTKEKLSIENILKTVKGNWCSAQNQVKVNNYLSKINYSHKSHYLAWRIHHHSKTSKFVKKKKKNLTKNLLWALLLKLEAKSQRKSQSSQNILLVKRKSREFLITKGNKPLWSRVRRSKRERRWNKRRRRCPSRANLCQIGLKKIIDEMMNESIHVSFDVVKGVKSIKILSITRRFFSDHQGRILLLRIFFRRHWIQLLDFPIPTQGILLNFIFFFVFELFLCFFLFSLALIFFISVVGWTDFKDFFDK